MTGTPVAIQSFMALRFQSAILAILPSALLSPGWITGLKISDSKPWMARTDAARLEILGR